jgi:DNA polymerase-3 subunit gamma/tau
LARSNTVSPFAADSARKGSPKAEAPGNATEFADRGARATQSGANVVIMGSAAPAVAEISPDPRYETAITVETGLAPSPATAESLRDAVLNALGNQPMLVSMLENAEWTLQANALIARAAASSTMIEMSFTADARRIASAAASGRAGRPVRMQVETGGATQTPSAPRRAAALNGSARSRAEQDPIVQRMQEKFGAEIRTVIDYREKG